MDMQALLIFQIIADVVLCAAILFLLMRIGRNIGRAGSPVVPVVEEKYLAELGKLIQESHAEAEHFSLTIDASCAKFKDMAAYLEAQEAKLATRLQEINQQLEKCHPPLLDSTRDHAADNKYANIIALLKTGRTVKEVAQQSGLTEGEVSLIFELEKKKTETV